MSQFPNKLGCNSGYCLLKLIFNSVCSAGGYFSFRLPLLSSWTPPYIEIVSGHLILEWWHFWKTRKVIPPYMPSLFQHPPLSSKWVPFTRLWILIDAYCTILHGRKVWCVHPTKFSSHFWVNFRDWRKLLPSFAAFCQPFSRQFWKKNFLFLTPNWIKSWKSMEPWK